MEKTYNPALIQRTQRYMETHSISQNQFAAKVNLSSAALSSYLNQKYKGSVEAVERQLSEFFKLDEEAEAAAEKTASLLPRAAYVPTSISEDVCQSIRFAQLEHCMVVLHGDAGVGKSKGAQKFLRDHPTNAVGISITPSTGTLNGSIELAPILGLSDVIVDIVETGTTLRENGLQVVTEFMPISARFIANKASYQFKHRQMDTMLEKLRDTLHKQEEEK